MVVLDTGPSGAATSRCWLSYYNSGTIISGLAAVSRRPTVDRSSSYVLLSSGSIMLNSLTFAFYLHGGESVLRSSSPDLRYRYPIQQLSYA